MVSLFVPLLVADLLSCGNQVFKVCEKEGRSKGGGGREVLKSVSLLCSCI